MRILFIQSPSVEGASQEMVYPIGIVILAGSLREYGHAVEIIDMNVEPDPFGTLKNRLLGFGPDVVALSLRNIDPLGNKTSSLIPPFLAAVRLIAAVRSEAWIIAGGAAFSLFPERLMRAAPEIDYGIVGEAEGSLPLLLASLENPPRITGLCRRDRTRITIDAPPQGLDMTRYVRPDRDLLDLLKE